MRYALPRAQALVDEGEHRVHSSKTKGIFFTVALLAAVLSQGLWAQQTSGVIQGQITDPQGSVVPAAKVIVINSVTNVKQEGQSNQTGFYLFPLLLPGTYTVEIAASGFRGYVRQNVIVTVDSITRVDAGLQIGALSDSITITAASPTLKTDRTDVSITIDSSTIQNLPLLGRNISFLQNMVPGTIATGRGNVQLGDVNLYSNGIDSGFNFQSLDGVNNKQNISNSGALVLASAEAVQEVKITTNSYDAESGQAGGMMMMVTTKSGTNALHGSAFEYLRNSVTSARDPFSESFGTVSPFKYNQFGGTVGGPVKKDKLFFFGSYEGWRIREGASGRTTVPTAAFRQGDFSAWSSTYQIVDPLTGNSQGQNRAPFNQNTIPASRINSASRKIMDAFPAANSGGPNDYINNYYKGYSAHTDQDQYMGRMDWAISEKSQMFGRYTYNPLDVYTPTPFGEPLQPTNHNTINSQSMTINYVRTLTPNLVVEARTGFSRSPFGNVASDLSKKTAESFGIPNVNVDGKSGGMMRMQVGGPVGGFDIGDSANGLGIQTNATYAGGLVYNRGSHTLKVGMEKDDLYFSEDGYSKGAWNFTQNVTASADIPNSGISLATFLLGTPNSLNGRNSITIPRRARQNVDGYYAQDQWRITPKVTLIYGVRYEYLSPIWSPVKGGGSQFNLATGFVDIANIGTVDRYANVKKDLNNFGPRLGLAYRFAPKMVFRAGFGRMFTHSGWDQGVGGYTGLWPTNAGIAQTADNPWYGLSAITNGPPAMPAAPIFDPSGHMRPPNGVSLGGEPKNNPTTSVDSWNAAIQHEFRSNWSYEIAYVGNVAKHLAWSRDANAATPGPGPVTSRQPYNILYGLTSSVSDRSREDSSSYNSLQLKVEKRFANDWTFGSAFTWGKNLIQSGYWAMQNPFCRDCNKSRTGYDVAQVWRLWGSYELPFGPRKAFMSNAKGVTRQLVEGWSIGSMTSLRSGWPINVTVDNTSHLNARGVGSWRADRVGPGKADHPTVQQWLKLSDFTMPADYTFGNSGGYILDGPGTIVSDIELSKSWYLREATKLKFRVSGFNALNIHGLGNPWSASIDNPTFGQITSSSGTMRRVEFGLNLSF